MRPAISCRPVRLVPFRASLSGLRAAEVRPVPPKSAWFGCKWFLHQGKQKKGRDRPVSARPEQSRGRRYWRPCGSAGSRMSPSRPPATRPQRLPHHDLRDVLLVGEREHRLDGVLGFDDPEFSPQFTHQACYAIRPPGVGRALAGEDVDNQEVAPRPLDDAPAPAYQLLRGLAPRDAHHDALPRLRRSALGPAERRRRDRKSTRLNSSHLVISYAVFCLKK